MSNSRGLLSEREGGKGTRKGGRREMEGGREELPLELGEELSEGVAVLGEAREHRFIQDDA